jgi:plasmid stability protein
MDRLAVMALSLMPILIHSEAVSAEVRAVLRAAEASPPEKRRAELEAAARLLYGQFRLDCRDVRELVGLGPKHEC